MKKKMFISFYFYIFSVCFSFVFETLYGTFSGRGSHWVLVCNENDRADFLLILYIFSNEYVFICRLPAGISRNGALRFFFLYFQSA